MTPEQFQIALAANRAQLAGYAGLAAALVAMLKTNLPGDGVKRTQRG